MSGFAFKQFKVQQNNAAMKVSTDGIMLGAWADLTGVKHLLDIGTGTGLLALMCKQRNQTLSIDAVELDPKAVIDARQNILQSPWSDDIKVHECAIQTFKSSQQFDVVISNPPYFNHSLKGRDQHRNRARHTDGLSYTELLRAYTLHSHARSRLAVVLPSVEAQLFIQEAAQMGFHLHRHCEVQMTPTKPASRSLMEFTSRADATTIRSRLCVRDDAQCYTDDYIALCRAFYLKM